MVKTGRDQNLRKAQNQKVFFLEETKSKKRFLEANSEERFLRRVEMTFFKPSKVLAKNKNHKKFGVSHVAWYSGWILVC